MPETLPPCHEQVAIRRDGRVVVATCDDHGLGHYSTEFDLSWPAGDGELVREDPIPDDLALRHFVRRALAETTSRCELTADKPDHGRCPRSAAAVRLEDGFSDVVCGVHAASAEARGAQVLRP